MTSITCGWGAIRTIKWWDGSYGLSQTNTVTCTARLKHAVFAVHRANHLILTLMAFKPFKVKIIGKGCASDEVMMKQQSSTREFAAARYPGQGGAAELRNTNTLAFS